MDSSECLQLNSNVQRYVTNRLLRSQGNTITVDAGYKQSNENAEQTGEERLIIKC